MPPTGPTRLEGGSAGEIPLEDQEERAAARRAKMNKVAGPSGTAYAGQHQLFGAIRAGNQDRAKELLQTGADANASEPAPWWIIGCFVAMPCMLLCVPPCCAHEHYSKRALHVAMVEGDPDMVKLLIESGADPTAPAVCWNCCACCTWNAQAQSFQDALMVEGNHVSAPKQAEIKRLIQGQVAI